MFKRIIMLAAGFSLIVGVASPVMVSASVFDGSKTAVCEGVALQEDATCASIVEGKKDPNAIIKLSLSIFSAIVGVISVVVIIIAGVKYITSSGDSSKVAQAKDTLLYAVIGLVVVMLAQVIVRLVIFKVKQP